MTMLAFRTRASVYPRETVPGAELPARREKLAIVSTGSRLCGVAAYTAALRRQLSEAFDVTVFDLDQYLLRSTHRRVRHLADQHIKHICEGIAEFDAVNLQLEHGTLGQHASDIYRRFCWLAAAAPRLSVTFHTLLSPPRFDSAAFTKALLSFQWRAAGRVHAGYRRHRLLSRGLARHLRRIQQSKQVSAIVHNHRDLFDARYLYGIGNVFDHPLAFLGNAEADSIRSRASRQSLPMLATLPTDAVLIGVFGFLNEYKGVYRLVDQHF